MLQFNLKKSPEDLRDLTLNFKTNENISQQYDLSLNCTKVKNQGNIGSCTSYATIGALELLCKKYLKENKSQFQNIEDIFSEKFLYYITRVKIQKTDPKEDTGCYLRNVIKALTKYGVCLENSFPYDEKYYEAPSENCYKEALEYQTTKYARIIEGTSTFIDEIKNVIYNGNPVICGIRCYDNIFHSVGGLINMPTSRNKVIGGHAILLVGYDDRSKLFKFKNSWSDKWGDKGYGYLFYDYAMENIMESWIIYDTEIKDVELLSFNDKKDMLKKLMRYILENTGKINMSVMRNEIESKKLNPREYQLISYFLTKIRSEYDNVSRSLEL